MTVSGVPNGATFSAGTDNGDGTWTMGEADLNGLTMQVDDTVQQDFSLGVSVTSTEPNGDSATSTSTIDVALPEDSTVEADTSTDALDPLSAMFTDNDTLEFEGEEYDISSLTDGDSEDDYGDVAPLGEKHEMEDYDAHDSDGSDGYSSSGGSSDGGPGDDSC